MEEPVSTEENNSSESFKPLRPRSDSTSSCTSITSSDDEAPPLELTGKGKWGGCGLYVYDSKDVLRVVFVFSSVLATSES